MKVTREFYWIRAIPSSLNIIQLHSHYLSATLLMLIGWLLSFWISASRESICLCIQTPVFYLVGVVLTSRLVSLFMAISHVHLAGRR
jgi:hypothetical protein